LFEQQKLPVGGDSTGGVVGALTGGGGKVGELTGAVVGRLTGGGGKVGEVTGAIVGRLTGGGGKVGAAVGGGVLGVVGPSSGEMATSTQFTNISPKFPATAPGAKGIKLAPYPLQVLIIGVQKEESKGWPSEFAPPK